MRVLRKYLSFPKSGKKVKGRPVQRASGGCSTIEDSEVERIAGSMIKLASMRARNRKLKPGTKIEIPIPARAEHVSASDFRTAIVPQMDNRPFFSEVIRNKRGKKVAVLVTV